MNHLAGFQQLNAQLCREVAALRAKGYYGDGLYHYRPSSDLSA
jgi:hypothetical protein